MKQKLEGQTAIVTGAAQGIGRSIANRLGEDGASVVIADINSESARSTANELENKGIPAIDVYCDVTDPEDVNRLTSEAIARFESIDVLVNNAGIGGDGAFTDLDMNEWRKVIDVNLTGVFNCSRAVVPTMVAQGTGSIVNIASMAGRNISYHGAANYTASKWGVVGLTKHMAWDLGPDGVRVNAVCPGATLTPHLKTLTDEADRSETNQKIPLRRWAEPEDQANAVAYLASDQAAYVTGTVVEVDGGKQLGVRHEI